MEFRPPELNKYRFKIFAAGEELTKTIENMTEDEAAEKAYGWMQRGFFDKIGNKTVFCEHDFVAMVTFSIVKPRKKKVA
jgi:hypothetical protein